jgi:hypothetical protein
VYALGSVGGMGAGVSAGARMSGGFGGLLLYAGLALEYHFPLRRWLGLAVGVRFGWVQPALVLRLPRRGVDLPRLGSPRVQLYVGLSVDAA